MDTGYRLGIACVAAWGLALAVSGCNSEWSDRLPEVKQATAQPAGGQDAKIPETVSAPAPEVTAPAPESAADSALSSEVETALKAEPDLHGTSIAVRTDQGVVTLSGSAKDPQLRSMAAEVALSVQGVKLVRNEITLSQAT